VTELLVRHPPGFPAERTYILDVVLHEFLGIRFETLEEAREDVLICAASGSSTAEIQISDIFFRTRQEHWLKPESLPTLPLRQCEVAEELSSAGRAPKERLPVLYGMEIEGSGFFECSGERIWLGLDIFGSAFFMLSRYEEACPGKRDVHNRFPAGTSVLAAEGYLERPIINEYVEILRASLDAAFPGIKMRRRSYRSLVSHDVDRVFMTRDLGWGTVLRNSAGDLIHRRDPSLAARRLRSRFWSGRGEYRYEPTNTFEFVMDCSERKGLRSSFYWIAKGGAGQFDADYDLGMPWIRRLIKRIADRGHELGLHGSYDSYDQPSQIKAELEALISVAESVGVRQDLWGARQHYLRWDAESSWQHLEKAGLGYDTTLGFPEAAGFRCGVCYEYPVFSLHTRKRLEFRERPLVAMDVSLLSDSYMGLPVEAAIEKITTLANQCRRYGGDFTLLWHNDKLVYGWERRMYEKVLEGISS